MEAINARMAALERQLRLQRAIIGGLLVALVAGLGYAATDGVVAELRAKRLVIVDDAGNEVVRMRGTAYGGVVAVRSSEDSPRSAIVIGIGGNRMAGIALRNPDGKSILALLATPEGTGRLELVGRQGEARVFADVDAHGNGRLGVVNHLGVPFGGFVADADGQLVPLDPRETASAPAPRVAPGCAVAVRLC